MLCLSLALSVIFWLKRRHFCKFSTINMNPFTLKMFSFWTFRLTRFLLQDISVTIRRRYPASFSGFDWLPGEHQQQIQQVPVLLPRAQFRNRPFLSTKLRSADKPSRGIEAHTYGWDVPSLVCCYSGWLLHLKNICSHHGGVCTIPRDQIFLYQYKLFEHINLQQLLLYMYSISTSST